MEPVYPTLIIPITVPTQLPNMCLTHSMEIANHIFGGTINGGDYILDYLRTYGVFIGLGGNAPTVENIPSFINKHFNTSSFTSYSEAMRNNYLVFVDAPSKIPNSGHNVIVVGYKGNNNLLIIDPETGKQDTVSANSVGNHYRIVIIGIKN